MSTVTDTEILALRARHISVVHICKRTGASKKRVRQLLVRHGMFLNRTGDPARSEMRVHLEVMHADLKSCRLLLDGQALQIERLTQLLGALALDLTEPVDAAGPEDAPMIPVPALPPRRVKLSRTHRILQAERPETKSMVSR